MTDKQYDVIVAGAGHNNLGAACYLAKAGLKVLVLEKNAFAGGGAVSREVTLPGFRHDIHATGVLHLQGSAFFKELELTSKFGLEFQFAPASFVTAFDDGDVISSYFDLDRTCQSIAKFSQKDADRYRKLVIFMQGVLPVIGLTMSRPPVSFGNFMSFLEKTPMGEELITGMLKSSYDLIMDYFEHPKVQAHFLKTTTEGLLTSPEDKTTGLIALFLIGGSHTRPNGIAVGGTQSVTDSMVRCLEHHGGEIRYNTWATRIITSGGEVMGVETSDGPIMAKKAVIAAIHPHLLGDKVDGLDEGLLERARRTQNGTISIMSLHGALNEAPKWNAGEAVSEGLYTSLIEWEGLERLRRDFDELRYGYLPPKPTAIVSVHTNYDKTRAPEGKHTIYCGSWAPTHPTDMPFSDWDKIKESYADKVWQKMAHFAPNLSGDNILARYIESPLDMQRHTPSFQLGFSPGVSVHAYQLLGMRPTPELSQYRVPGAKGLYLGGAYMHPGPGLTGGGRPLSMRIMEDIGVDYSKVILS